MGAEPHSFTVGSGPWIESSIFHADAKNAGACSALLCCYLVACGSNSQQKRTCILTTGSVWGHRKMLTLRPRPYRLPQAQTTRHRVSSHRRGSERHPIPLSSVMMPDWFSPLKPFLIILSCLFNFNFLKFYFEVISTPNMAHVQDQESHALQSEPARSPKIAIFHWIWINPKKWYKYIEE